MLWRNDVRDLIKHLVDCLTAAGQEASGFIVSTNFDLGYRFLVRGLEGQLPEFFCVPLFLMQINRVAVHLDEAIFDNLRSDGGDSCLEKQFFEWKMTIS